MVERFQVYFKLVSYMADQVEDPNYKIPWIGRILALNDKATDRNQYNKSVRV